jgi:flagellar biogenesis protein FliO
MTGKPGRITFMMRNIATLAFLTLASLSVQAGVKVTSLNLKTSGPTGYVQIALEGRASELPDLKVFGNTIEMTISDAESFHAITKNISGALLSANTLNGKAIVKAVLPYNVNRDGVNLDLKNKSIEISFPRGGKVTAKLNADRPVVIEKTVAASTALPVLVKENKILKKVENTVPKEALNENYLDKLMKEDAEKLVVRNADAPSRKSENDEVNLKQSAISKGTPPPPAQSVPANTVGSGGISLAGYAVKFSVFLALVLGVFYGVVYLLKRGVFNRGKLGFLNNTQMIQVLSTTYVAPKRSLMVVKVHKQVFLIANSENGIEFLSEMTDTTGLIKEGEKMVTGTNFDINLGAADVSTDELNIKLKENINESTPIPEEKGIAALTAKDIVKFSDELKKKAKKLKPIEFN